VLDDALGLAARNELDDAERRLANEARQRRAIDAEEKVDEVRQRVAGEEAELGLDEHGERLERLAGLVLEAGAEAGLDDLEHGGNETAHELGIVGRLERNGHLAGGEEGGEAHLEVAVGETAREQRRELGKHSGELRWQRCGERVQNAHRGAAVRDVVGAAQLHEKGQQFWPLVAHETDARNRSNQFGGGFSRQRTESEIERGKKKKKKKKKTVKNFFFFFFFFCADSLWLSDDVFEQRRLNVRVRVGELLPVRGDLLSQINRRRAANRRVVVGGEELHQARAWWQVASAGASAASWTRSPSTASSAPSSSCTTTCSSSVVIVVQVF
jgi:hypothetical protein